MKLFVPVLAFVSTSLFAADVRIVEEIVAKCNGDIVTRADIERAHRDMIGALRQNGIAGASLEEQLAEADKNILRDRLDNLLLVQKAKDLNISVDSEITKRVAQIQRDSGIADPEKFQEYVKQGTGMSFEDFKSEMKNDMLRQRVIRQEVADSMHIKHEELEKYYNEHKADFVREERLFIREILVAADPKDPAAVAAAEKKAKDLVTRARRGERFPELARDNSDAVTAKAYGELEPRGYRKGEISEQIADAVWSQPKGYVSDPLKVSNGFEIIRVDEHQKEGQAELAEVENDIQEKLYAPRMQPAVREYLTKLRVDAFLEVKPDYVDTGAAPGKDTSWVDPATLKPETISKKDVNTKPKNKKLLWAVPIPGTRSTKSTSSSQ